METGNREFYSLVLSLTAACPGVNVGLCMESMGPEEIYGIISSVQKPETRDFILPWYSPDPRQAAHEILRVCEKKKIRIICRGNDDYPLLLREIADPPLVLYCCGPSPSALSVSIVGTREADLKSGEVARRLARELSADGITVVSGMAVGIDRAAHEGALGIKGATVAVLANGIDVMYPWANRDLYRRIVESPGSSVLSEYPPGVSAGKWTFVKRNRIISGLSRAVIIVKAGERSGALITARYAIEQNRELFVCPGYAFEPAYAGCHRLIREGAALLSCTEDVLNEIPWFKQACVPAHVKELSAAQTESFLFPIADETADIVSGILEYLSSGEADIDKMIRDMKLETRKAGEALTVLELEGRIMRQGNRVGKAS